MRKNLTLLLRAVAPRSSASLPPHVALGALLSAGIIGGCAAGAMPSEEPAELSRRIPLPPAAMLAAAPVPSCSAAASTASATPPAAPAPAAAPPAATAPAAEPAADATLAQRLKLEFERDCYKAAEAQMRRRLARLQAAARATARAVERLE